MESKCALTGTASSNLALSAMRGREQVEEKSSREFKFYPAHKRSLLCGAHTLRRKTMLNSQVDEIKNRLDIVEVLSGYIKLQKAGANFRASCPFHSEKIPSFMVSPSRQIWHCFGCGAGGDIFGFVMKIENLEFPEALKILADKAGVVLRREDPKLRSEKTRLLEICAAAAKFFEFCLHEKDFGKPVLEYLRNRGLKEETIREFRVGFAPDSWNSLLRFLMSRGYKGEEIEKAGLVIKSDPSSARGFGGQEKTVSRHYYDRFRSRIMFPICDSNGRMVGFSGRIFQLRPSGYTGQVKGKEDEAKYVNTPATSLYDKSRILYGLDKSKNDIRKAGCCFLVEGQMDLIMAWQDGVRNIAATSGTALTSEHLNIIKRYADNLIFGFDMDEAGQTATSRGIDLAMAGGLNVKIIVLEQGKDPADFVRERPGGLKTVLESARPIMDYYFERAFRKHDFGSGTGIAPGLEEKKEIAAFLLPQIKKIYNKIEQAHWLEKLAQRLGVPIGFLSEELKKIKAGAGPDDYSPEFPNSSAGSPDRRELLAERLAALALRRPEHRALLSGLEANLPGQFSIICENLLCGGEQFSFENFYQKLSEELQKKVDYLILKADWEVELNPGLDFRTEIQKTVAELNIQKIKDDLKVLEAELKRAQEARNEDLIFATTKKFQELLVKLLKFNEPYGEKK